MTLSLPSKHSRSVRLTQPPQHLCAGRWVLGCTWEKTITTLAFRATQSAAFFSVICRWESWGSLEDFYDNYNATYMLILLCNIAHETTT